MDIRQDSNCHEFEVSAASMAVPLLDPKQELGHYLADKRDAMNMSVDQIARTTKIPRASLLHLEAGRFDKLPGDVFVRGFLRSYSRCVAIDGDEVVARYAQCGLMPAPVSSELADSLVNHRRRKLATGTEAPRAAAQASEEGGPSAKGEAVKKVLRDAFDLRRQRPARREESRASKSSKPAKQEAIASESPKAGKKRAPEAVAVSELDKPVRTFIPPSLNFDEDMSRRGPLTLGVIILVIVATLTMSYLLRRPGTSTDGFTMNREAPAMFGSSAIDALGSAGIGSALRVDFDAIETRS